MHSATCCTQLLTRLSEHLRRNEKTRTMKCKQSVDGASATASSIDSSVHRFRHLHSGSSFFCLASSQRSACLGQAVNLGNAKTLALAGRMLAFWFSFSFPVKLKCEEQKAPLGVRKHNYHCFINSTRLATHSNLASARPIAKQEQTQCNHTPVPHADNDKR